MCRREGRPVWAVEQPFQQCWRVGSGACGALAGAFRQDGVDLGRLCCHAGSGAGLFGRRRRRFRQFARQCAPDQKVAMWLSQAQSMRATGRVACDVTASGRTPKRPFHVVADLGCLGKMGLYKLRRIRSGPTNAHHSCLLMVASGKQEKMGRGNCGPFIGLWILLLLRHQSINRQNHVDQRGSNADNVFVEAQIVRRVCPREAGVRGAVEELDHLLDPYFISRDQGDRLLSFAETK